MSSPSSAPRKLNSFGVSGLLGEECKVYFHTITGPEAIGRISDLLAVKLRVAQGDELALRFNLLRLVFEAMKILPKGQPVELECGLDSVQIGLGVSFALPAHETLNLETLKTQFALPNPKDRFALILKDARSFGLGTVVRWHESTRRIEFVILISLEGSSNRCDFVALEARPASAPKPFSYSELGDVADTAKKLQQIAKSSGASQLAEPPKQGFFKSVFGFIKGIWEGESVTVVSGGGDSSQNQLGSQATVVAGTPGVATETAQTPKAEIKAAEVLADIDNLSVLMRQDMAREDVAAGSIRSVLKDSAARRLFDQTLLDMANERARIRETAREMTALMRQQEQELKGKEVLFNKALREKEEQLKQKTIALERSREQLVNASIEIDKARGSVPKVQETATLKQKLTLVEKEAQLIRDKNTELNSKVDELKAKLNLERNNQTVRTMEQSSTDTDLKGKLIQATRLTDELKKNNQRLMDRLEQAQRKQTSEVEAEENRKKLMAASKMIMAGKRDVERLNTLIENSRRQEAMLKGELKKLQNEVMKYKTGIKKAS